MCLLASRQVACAREIAAGRRARTSHAVHPVASRPLTHGADRTTCGPARDERDARFDQTLLFQQFSDTGVGGVVWGGGTAPCCINIIAAPAEAIVAPASCAFVLFARRGRFRRGFCGIASAMRYWFPFPGDVILARTF